ncbi:MAG: pyridoxine 5'-phosphate synthase [Pseudomonadota bacterium]
MTLLSINLNKVALLRNQREMSYPSVLGTAEAVIAAGARGITVHPRPDERHIRRQDVRELSALIEKNYRNEVEFNVEGYPTDDFVALVLETRPRQVTMVPDPPEAHTSDQGWDFVAHKDFLKERVATFKAAGLRVAAFTDPDPEAVAQAQETGTDRVEIYTGPYGAAYGGRDQQKTFEACCAAGLMAREVGLGLNAGHDLNLENLPPLRQALPWLDEVSIGHAFTADALIMGYDLAVKSYLKALTI